MAIPNKERCKTYYKTHREERLAASKRRNITLRREVLQAYGGHCICCKEDTYEFLALDHVNNDGNVHRKTKSSWGGLTTTQWAKKNNYPPSLQILCHNCNQAKAKFGGCPHGRAK